MRNRSWAWRLTVSTRSRRLSPGISTTMNRLPCTVTSASATPEPLTRWSMILRASLSDSALGLPLGVSRMLVPPWRSRPSSGFQVPARATSPKAIASPRKNTAEGAPGPGGLACHLSSPPRLPHRRSAQRRAGPGFVPDHLADRAAGDLDGHAVGDLDVRHVVVEAAHGAEDARGEHHLVPHLQRGLHAHKFLLPAGLWAHEEQPEEQRDTDQGQHWESVLHEGEVYGGGVSREGRIAGVTGA